jgi:hypothetical protein
MSRPRTLVALATAIVVAGALGGERAAAARQPSIVGPGLATLRWPSLRATLPGDLFVDVTRATHPKTVTEIGTGAPLLGVSGPWRISFAVARPHAKRLHFRYAA